jgi:hypothetical protein
MYIKADIHAIKTPPFQYTSHLYSTIKIVRDSVVEERALLEVWEVDGLCREVKVLSRALAATDRLPRA